MLRIGRRSIRCRNLAVLLLVAEGLILLMVLIRVDVLLMSRDQLVVFRPDNQQQRISSGVHVVHHSSVEKENIEKEKRDSNSADNAMRAASNSAAAADDKIIPALPKNAADADDKIRPDTPKRAAPADAKFIPALPKIAANADTKFIPAVPKIAADADDKLIPAARKRAAKQTLLRGISSKTEIGRSLGNGKERMDALLGVDSNSSAVEKYRDETVPFQYGSADRRTVLIHTRYRSGSSFIGSLFDENPDVFYMFEPFRQVVRSNAYEGATISNKDEIFRGYTKDLFSCRFQRMVKNTKAIDWTVRIFGEARVKIKHPVTYHEKQCAEHQHVVIKAINVRNLESVWNETKLGLHIVEFLRDPRGMFSSFLKINDKGTFNTSKYNLTWFLQELGTHCDAMVEDVEYLQSLQAVNTSHYTLLRYENLATEPELYTKALYTKIGITYTPAVAAYVHRATTGGTTKDKRRVKDPYGTIRDSKKTAFSWMTHLPLHVIRQVEARCADAMRVMGYKVLDTNKVSFANVTAADLVLPDTEYIEKVLIR